MTGAAPFRTSILSAPAKFKVVIAGLKAPPQVTPSTTRRQASNSCRPHKDGTTLEGPASPPGGAAAPGTRPKAVAISLAPRAPSSLRDTTEMKAGISSAGAGIRVAVTTTPAGSASVRTAKPQAYA